MDDHPKAALIIAIQNYLDTRTADISSYRSLFSEASHIVTVEFIRRHEQEILELKSPNSQQAFNEAVLFAAITVASELAVAALAVRFVTSIIRVSNISRSVIKSGNTSILKNLSALKIVAKADDVLKNSTTFQLQTKTVEKLINQKIKEVSTSDNSSETPATPARIQKKSYKSTYENLSNSIQGYLTTQHSIVIANCKYFRYLTLHDSTPHLTNEETKKLISVLEDNSVPILSQDSEGEYGESSFMSDFLITTIYLSIINLYKTVNKHDIASLNEVLAEPAMGYDTSKKVKSLYNTITTNSGAPGSKAASLSPYRLTILDKKHWSFLRSRAIAMLGVEQPMAKTNTISPTLHELLNPSVEYKIMSAHASSKEDIRVFNFLAKIEDSLNRSEFNLFN